MSRTPVVLALVCLVLTGALAGCAKRDAPSGAAQAAQAADPSPGAPATPTLERAVKVGRKIIRNAELRMTVASANGAQREAAKIAEQFGGYLVSSDASASASEDESEPGSVRVVLRVDAEKFDAALDAVRRLGKHVGSESISSKDVTEEWVDLEARIKTQKKLEEQYLEIAKSASKVDDMLTVQKQLAEVRGEIEKLEGRKRFLDNQVSLSTITLSFDEERPLVSVTMSAFGRAARHAWADAQNVTAGIILGMIRLVGVMLPITLLVLLPLFLLAKRGVRRLMRATAPS